MSRNYRDARDYQVRDLPEEMAGLMPCAAGGTYGGQCASPITHEVSFAYTLGRVQQCEVRHTRFVCAHHAEKWAIRKGAEYAKPKEAA